MRKKRNQCLAVLLSCSLLTSMMPLSSVNVSAAENDMSVSENYVSAVESPVPVLEDVPEEADFVSCEAESDDGNTLTATESYALSVVSDYLGNGSCGTNLTYVLDGSGCLTITGEGDMTNYTSPSAVPWYTWRSMITTVSFDGKITNIGAYAFDYCVSLTSITIPDSVTSIGEYSFYGCSSLSKISIPKKVTAIGASAFSDCTSLRDVTIGEQVTSIGASAFAGCTNLVNITIPDSVISVGEGAFDGTGIDTDQIAFRRGSCGADLKWELLGNHRLRISGTGDMTDFSLSSVPWYNQRKEITEVILSAGVTGIGDYAFYGCKSLSTVTLADTVTSIGKYAFTQCTGVSGLDLKNITEIEEHAFAQSGLGEVHISGDGTVTLGNDAFADCGSLKTVTLEQCTLNTGNNIWKGCTGLETVKISADFEKMGSYLFANCTSLSQVTLDKNCMDIGPYLFSGCTALTDITIPDGVTELGSYAFQNCTGIKEITLPDTVTAIQAGVFSGCSSLEKILFSEKLQTIGNYAFQNCIQFTSLIIPDSVTSMGSGVFSGCSKLESLTLPFVGASKDPEDAGQNTLFGYVFGTLSYTDAYAVKQYYSSSAYSTYYLPDSLVSVTVTGGMFLCGAFDNCSQLKQITIPNTLTSLAPYMYRGCTGLDHIVVADVVTEIGDYALSGCIGLESISLPESVQRIGSGAFSGCASLKEIKLPEDITQIASSTFQGCTSLTGIAIPENVESIDAEAFRGCSAMKNISLPANLTELGSGVFWDCTGLQQITLMSEITVINDYMFYGCTALEQVVMTGALTEIDSYAFAGCVKLENISIPETVTKIGNYTFSGCEAIQSIKLPQEITQIGNFVFQNCVGLTEMEVSENIASIGSAAFSGCSALQRLNLPFIGGKADAEDASASTLFGYVFGTTSYTDSTAAKQYYSSSGSVTYYIPDSLTEVEIAGGKIWYGSFSGCNHLKSIRFLSEESISDIGAKAFQGCVGLKNMTLPDGVDTIGDYAFSGCTGLETVYGINTVESIGSYAFQNCSSMKSISLPETITTINAGAFSGCSSLESMTLPFVGGSASQETAARTSLFGYIFGTASYTGGVATKQYYSSSGYSTYYIPESLKAVSVTGGRLLYGAFYNCTGITSLSLPKDLTEIGNYALYNCAGLTGQALPKGVTKIGSYAFSDCSGLTELVLPVSVESIGAYAFQNCTALCDISIPEKVTSIESYLFSGCTSLKNITLPAGVQTIGTYAFRNCSSMTEITVPDSVTEIGSAVFSGCGSLQNMALPFVGSSSSLTSASAKTLFGYIFGSQSYTGGIAVKQMYSSVGTTYYIPESLTSVRISGGKLLYGAFYGCSGLTHLTVPDNLTEVGNYAFYQCSGLKEISLSDSVTSIGNYAFAGCAGLQEFSLPSKVSRIANYTFSGCTSLNKIVIPEGVTEIGTGAFQNCSNLTSIIVPDSVTAIGSSAFSGCSKLQSMTLPFTGYSATASSVSTKTLFGYIFGTASYKGGVATKQYYSSNGNSTYYIPESLKNVVITGGGIQVMYGTFYGCSGLTNITMPPTVTQIGQKAFCQCTGLSEIVIPQNVTSIAANAFADCTGLRYVTFSGKAPQTITATAFTNVTATVFYPASETTWNDLIGNQYGGTLTWQAHTHSYQSVVTAATCTEQGYTTWRCTGCNSSYDSDYVDALGHAPVTDQAVQASCSKTGLTEGSHCSVCGEVIVPQMTTQKTEHRFTEYVSNEDATYEQDGTKTAQCIYCQQTETVTDSGSMLVDQNKPAIEITVGTNHWTGFFHTITFGLFFKNTQTVTIQAADEEKLLDGSTVNRLDGVYYYISDREIQAQDLELVAWKPYTTPLELNPDKKYIVYAKAVDLSNNTTYTSSEGMIVDHTAPVIDGISDGQTYCEKAAFTVGDLSLQSVTDNGAVMEAKDGLYSIDGDDQMHRIIATDDCGNTTEIVIVVSRHHAWDEPVFSWEDSYRSCTAEYTCSRDTSHMAWADCTVRTQSPDATCTKAGRVVYTATASLDGVAASDTKTVSGVTLGHDYTAVFTWTGDRSACTVTLTCQRAGCSEDTTGHLLSRLPCVVETRTTAATCISQGKKEVVASLVVDGKEYTDVCGTEILPVDDGNHVHLRNFNRREATCLSEGATGDVYCLDCYKIVEESTPIQMLAHVWDDGQVTKTATCMETGIRSYTCIHGCGTVWEKETPVDAENHGNLRIVGAIEATATEAGYTGDTYCADCMRTVVHGKVIPAGSTGSPSPDPGSNGNPLLPVSGGNGPTPAPGDSAMVLAKGTVFVAGDFKYKVTSAAKKKLTVTVQEPKSKTKKKLTIPATVKMNGCSYQVTAIADNAFRNCSKLKKITIGKNVTAIGKNAFYQTKKLKQITVLSTKITKVGKNAWKGIHKKAVIKVPKKKRKKYRKLFRNKGQKKTVEIR